MSDDEFITIDSSFARWALVGGTRVYVAAALLLGVLVLRTVYIEKELSYLSRVLLYVGVPVEILTGGVLAVYGAVGSTPPNPTAPEPGSSLGCGRGHSTYRRTRAIPASR